MAQIRKECEDLPQANIQRLLARVKKPSAEEQSRDLEERRQKFVRFLDEISNQTMIAKRKIIEMISDLEPLERGVEKEDATIDEEAEASAGGTKKAKLS